MNFYPALGGAYCNQAGTYYAQVAASVIVSGVETMEPGYYYAQAYTLSYAQACICGNGACQSSYGENCAICPGDCLPAGQCCWGTTSTPSGTISGTNLCNSGTTYTCGSGTTNCQLRDSYYCDIYSQRPLPNPPGPYWTTNSIFTTNTGNILCNAGIEINCTAGNMCQQAGTTGYYCDTNNTWINQSNFVRGSIICNNGTKYVSNATIKVKTVNNTINLDQVKVDIVDDNNKLILLDTNMTNSNGLTGFNMSNKSGYPYRLVSIIASRSDFMISIVERFKVYYNQENNITIKMTSENDCLSDCTRMNDQNHLCAPECDGLNGCAFSIESKPVCTNPKQVRGARKIIDDNSVNQTVVYCCGGSTIIEKKNTNTSINCNGKEMVKMTKIVIINGEPVKMNVIACSSGR